MPAVKLLMIIVNMIKTVVTARAVHIGIISLHGMSKLVLPTTVRFSMIDVEWIQTAVATCAIWMPMYAHLPVLLQELGVILQ